MSSRTIVTLVLALFFGGAATLGVNQVYTQKQEAPRIETAPVVVASMDISRGRVLAPENLKVREWPKELIPEGCIDRVDAAVGRSSLVGILKDEPMLDKKLASKDAGRGVAALVPRGMRAFTIHTPTAASGVGGFVLPGNKVDVLLTVTSSSAGDGSGGGSTTTLLQCVEIMAVDQRLEAPAENKVDPRELRSVTLLVTPDQAAKLSLAMDKGTLHLSLRNPEDTESADAQPVTLADIRYRQENPPMEVVQPSSAPPAAATPSQSIATLEVRTLRGRQHGLIQVEPLLEMSSSP